MAFNLPLQSKSCVSDLLKATQTGFQAHLGNNEQIVCSLQRHPKEAISKASSLHRLQNQSKLSCFERILTAIRNHFVKVVYAATHVENLFKGI